MEGAVLECPLQSQWNTSALLGNELGRACSFAKVVHSRILSEASRRLFVAVNEHRVCKKLAGWFWKIELFTAVTHRTSSIRCLERVRSVPRKSLFERCTGTGSPSRRSVGLFSSQYLHHPFQPLVMLRILFA